VIDNQPFDVDLQAPWQRVIINLMIEEGRAALRAGDASRARDAFERALEDRLPRVSAA
jgi:hypothetical protein